MNDKYLAAPSVTSCTMPFLKTLYFFPKSRSFIKKTSTKTITTYTPRYAAEAEIETSSDTISDFYDANGNLYIKDTGVDYSQSSISALNFSLLEIQKITENETEKCKIHIDFSVPILDDNFYKATKTGAFERSIDMNGGERVEWRDLIDVELSINNETALNVSPHIGANAKIILEYDASARTHNDSHLPDNISANMSLYLYVNPTDYDYFDSDYQRNGTNDYYFPYTDYKVESTGPYPHLTKTEIFNATISLDKVYEKDSEGNDIICEFVYYSITEDITINGWFFPAGSVKYYIGEDSLVINDSEITATIRPEIQSGTIGHFIFSTYTITTNYVEEPNADGSGDTHYHLNDVINNFQIPLRQVAYADFTGGQFDIYYNYRCSGTPELFDSLGFCHYCHPGMYIDASNYPPPSTVSKQGAGTIGYPYHENDPIGHYCPVIGRKRNEIII